MAEGAQVKLSALPNGLTADLTGRKLLKQPFVFQCPPQDALNIVRAFTMGNYDTIENGQFVRRGSRQLRTWQFDTLAMELGVNASGTRHTPGWVPFPHYNSPGAPVPPKWYVEQLDTIHDAGAPFRCTISFEETHANGSPASVGPVLSKSALLLGFTESHKAGEGDAIYLTGVSFSEFRDPTQTQKGLGAKAPHHGRNADTPPTTVSLHISGVCWTKIGQPIVATLSELSKFFYHTPEHWRDIARANGLKGGGANTVLTKFSKFKHLGSKGAVIHIPAVLTAEAQYLRALENQQLVG